MNSESGETDQTEKPERSLENSTAGQSNSTPVSDKPAGDTKNDTTEQPEWQIRQHRVQLRVQLATVFVGIVVAIIYGCQLNEMRKATRIAADNYRLQTKALHIDQRAWVAPVAIGGKAELGKTLTITIWIKNSGKSFAKRCQPMLGWISKDIADPDPNFDDLVAQGSAYVTKGVALVLPDTVITQSLIVPKDGHKLTDEDIETFKTPTKVFFVFGKLTYFDIFNC